MDAWNFEIFRSAISALDRADAIEMEREFANRYQSALSIAGRDCAEALAKSEALFVLLQINSESAEYLRSHLR